MRHIMLSHTYDIDATKRASHILSFVLGIIFLTSGVGKLFSFNAFAETVEGVLRLSPASARSLAAGLVSFEIIGSAALLARFKLRLVATMFCLLLSAFISILLVASYSGREIECNCFGIFRLSLPNKGEALIDFVLLNLFAFLAVLYSPPRSLVKKGNKKLLWVSGVLILAYLEFSIVKSLEGKPESAPLRIEPIVSFAEKQNVSFERANDRNRLLLLLNFSDFNCPPCYDDFVMFCDLLNDHPSLQNEWRAMAIFQPDDFANPADPIRLTSWARSIGLAFPLSIAPDSLFLQARVPKSAAVIVASSGRIVFFETFPMGDGEHRRALSLLSDEHTW